MTLPRPIALLACALSLSALAQTPPPPPPEVDVEPPDEAWSPLPASAQPAPPPILSAPDEIPQPLNHPEDVAPPEVEEEASKTPVQADTPNEVSLFSGTALGAHKLGVGLAAGFPYLSGRVAYGVLPLLDVGLQVETVYGALTDVRALARYQLLTGGGWTLGAVADGGMAFFLESAQKEGQGMRWFTGRRNYNASAGLVASVQGPAPRSARLFADVRVHAAFDTEPYQRDPLGGVPAAVQVSWNIPTRLGAEFPQSRWTSILFAFGFDVHTRPDDVSLMPMVTLGLVTSLF